MPAPTDHRSHPCQNLSIEAGSATYRAHVRFDRKEHASRLQRGDHALQRLTGRREMVQQCAGDDEVVEPSSIAS